MDQVHPAYVLAALFAAAFVFVLARQRIERALARRRSRLRTERALRGEAQAEKLLERLGYTVEERQAPAVWTIAVDGQDHEVSLRADLVVARAGARFVAEVKTGNMAPRLTTASTRRQLLEYRVAYDVDGVLLVDVEAGRVMCVEFPLSAPLPSRSPAARIVSAFVVGIGLGVLAAHWLA